MRRGSIVLVAVVALVAAGCWRQDGYDAARTGYDPTEATLTAGNVAGLVRSWTATVPSGANAPVTGGTAVYVSAGSTVAAFETATGAQRWRTTLPTMSGFQGFVGPLTVPDVDLIAPVSYSGLGAIYTFAAGDGTPTGTPQFHSIPGGSIASAGTTRAYVKFTYGSGGPFVTTVEYDGQRGILSFSTSGAGSPTSPAIIGTHVVAGIGTTVYSFPLGPCPDDPSLPDGFCAAEWTANLPAAVQTPVGISADRIAVAMANGSVAVLDAATGATVFTAVTGSTAATMPAVAGDRMFVGGADGQVDVFAAGGCGAATCPPLWSFTTAAGVSISSQPAVGAGVVYAGTSAGRVYAFDRDGCGASTCPSLWSGRVDDSATPGAVKGPIVSGGAIYATTSTGAVARFGLP